MESVVKYISSALLLYIRNMEVHRTPGKQHTVYGIKTTFDGYIYLTYLQPTKDAGLLFINTE